MKICLCADIYYNVGVAETAYQYSLTAKKMGIDFAISGFVDNKAKGKLPLIGEPDKWDGGGEEMDGEEYSLTKENVKDVDLFVFYFDNGNFYDRDVYPGELEKLLRVLPREKAIVVDADGKYNKTLTYEGDSNHTSQRAGENWKHTFESISNDIYQTTLNPMNPNAKPFLFWGYKEPETKEEKEFDLLYLGSNWHRMEKLQRFLDNFDGIRSQFPKISVWGKNWTMPDKYWPNVTKPDMTYFKQKDIDLKEYTTKFGEFTQILGRSRFSPILVRPILSYTEMITPRMLETFASGTIPILTTDFEYVKQIYGNASEELFLRGDPIKKLVDMENNESYYRMVTEEVRKNLREHHSYENRLRELVEIAEGKK
ncbi:MAG: hypothetical protein ACOCP4_05785 [Candidatus Woesearchaeota archaeon]